MGQGGQGLGREGGVGVLPADYTARKTGELSTVPRFCRVKCIFDHARCLIRVAASDIHRYVRSLKRATKVGDVASYFSKIKALFTNCQGPCQGTRVDVVEGDPPEDVFRPASGRTRPDQADLLEASDELTLSLVTGAKFSKPTGEAFALAATAGDCAQSRQ